MNDVYIRIKQLCNNRGEDITTMCKKAGVSRSILSEFKMGRTKKLSTDTLAKLSNYFGVTVDYLLGNEQTKKLTAKSDELIDPIDQKIVDLLKKLNPRDKAAIMAQIDTLANLPSDKED